MYAELFRICEKSADIQQVLQIVVTHHMTQLSPHTASTFEPLPTAIG